MIYSAAVPNAFEEHGSVQEDIGIRGEINQSVTLRCAWADRYTLAADVIGRAWPHIGLNTYANKVSIRPVLSKYTQNEQAIVYEEALVTVNYDYLSYGQGSTTDPNTGDTVRYTDTFEPMVDIIQLESKYLRWGSATGEPVGEKGVKPIISGAFKFVRNIQGIRAIDPSMLTLLQTCNAEPVISAALGLTFPKETLQFIPPVIGNTVLEDGTTQGYTVKVGFAYKEHTWNKWYNEKTLTWDEQWIGTTNQRFKPFRTADYSRWIF